MTGRCLHCNEPSSDSEFCCLGCRAAYSIIHGAGLGAIYGQSVRDFKKPPELNSSEIKIFDHPDFLKENTQNREPGFRSGTFLVEGLMCSACVWVLERLPKILPSVISSRVDFGRSLITLVWRDEPEGLSRIVETSRKLGYRILSDRIDLAQAKIPKSEWIRLGVSGASAAGSMHIGLILLGSHGTDIDPKSILWVGMASGVVAAPAILYGGVPFFKTALASLKLKFLSSDFLVAASLIWGSIISIRNAWIGDANSYFDALAMIVFLLLAGRILIRSASLRTLQKPIWYAHRNGQMIPASGLKVGDAFEVMENEIIPVDCRLSNAEAWVDQSAVTGENLPVRVCEGQRIRQGTRALSSMKAVVEKRVNDSWIEALSRSLETESRDLKREKFESIFTVLILVLAVLTYQFASGDSLSKAIAILIVTCPCALQLSLPLVLTALRREGLQNAVSFLRPERAVALRNASVLAFDKTGTLTEGCLSLRVDSDLRALSRIEAGILYELCSQSDHPAAQAICFYLAGRPREKVAVEEMREIPGEGVRGRYQGQEVALIKTPSTQKFSSSFFVESRERGRFEFEDRMRDEAEGVLKNLKERGYKLWLLSGDRAQEVQTFISKIGRVFERSLGELSPQAKAELVHSKVVYVGDGLNDAAAFSKAGLAVGFSGSAEANLKTADVYLLKRDLQLIPNLLEALRRARRTIHLNYGVSVFYNLVTIGLVLMGYFGPILCAIFMPLSSLTVLMLSVFRRNW